MKKIISLALAATLVTAAAGITAYAVEYPGGTQNAVITTSVAPTFTVVIPTDTTVNFNSTSTDFGAVSLDSAQIAPDKAVKVELNASGTLKNSGDNAKTIAYTINNKDVGAEFTEATYKVQGENTDLTIDIAQTEWDAAFAGDYSDTVSFNISYVDAQ